MYQNNIINQYPKQRKVLDHRVFLSGLNISLLYSYYSKAKKRILEFMVRWRVRTRKQTFRLDQSYIAACLGYSREHVNRMLKELEEDNVISSRGVFDSTYNKWLPNEYELNFDLFNAATTNALKAIFPVLKFFYLSINNLIGSAVSFVTKKRSQDISNKVFNFQDSRMVIPLHTGKDTGIESPHIPKTQKPEEKLLKAQKEGEKFILDDPDYKKLSPMEKLEKLGEYFRLEKLKRP